MEGYSRSYERLNEVLQHIIKDVGPGHYNTLAPQSNIAKVLGHLGKYEESLSLFKDVMERMKRAGGHPLYLSTRANMASVMVRSGAYQEAIEHLQVVLEEQMRVAGPDHPDTLMVLNHLAEAPSELKLFSEALVVFTVVFNKRKETLGLDHPLTLIPQFHLGRIMLKRGEYLEALRTNNLVIERPRSLLSEIQGLTQSVLGAIGVPKKRVESEESTELQALCKKLELERLRNLTSSGHKNGVNGGLLADGIAGSTQVTTEERVTPPQIDASKDKAEHNEYLLEHPKETFTPEELIEFIDAQNIDGDTAVHYAAKSRSFNKVKALLRYGATYNMKNKQGKTPVDLTNEPKIKSFLGLIDEMFEGAKRGDPGVISKLKALDKDEQLAVISARDGEGYSLQQVSNTESLSNELSKLAV